MFCTQASGRKTQPLSAGPLCDRQSCGATEWKQTGPAVRAHPTNSALLLFMLSNARPTHSPRSLRAGPPELPAQSWAAGRTENVAGAGNGAIQASSARANTGACPRG